MLINIDNKKIHKNFMNFNEEETWLQKQLEEGWMLDRYSNDFEEGTYYTFRKIMEYERKRWIFKVDFREFDEQEEYDDYIDVFKESGWSTFSKKDIPNIYSIPTQTIQIKIFFQMSIHTLSVKNELCMPLSIMELFLPDF